jgi:hypothetical protein
MKSSLLIRGAGQIVQVVANRERYLRGNSESIKNLAVLSAGPGDSLCIVSIE